MQAFNPYLPSYEYIPDGEPYVFGDRVYVYGSHDCFNGFLFCLNVYVCWSAPLSDLSQWTCSGVIYRNKQDPMNRLGIRILFAPDVAVGPDGRYYLYYAYDFLGVMGVAVCDTPDGQYQFYGHVHYPDGTLWGRRKGDEFPIDPGVLVDDDGRVFLYSGFETKVPAIMSRLRAHRNSGGVVLELEPDMVTIRSGPKLLFPLKTNGAPEDFRGHEFFEASSIRKIDGKYVFVYSSTNNHELCYAVSERPDGEYRFGGTLVDQGDLYLAGNTDEKHAKNYLGNTHGGMVQLGEDWYIFYHRQTNRHSYSRQACAERLVRRNDGGFLQAEVTSCGLNGGPLEGIGEYPAYIACNLWSKSGTERVDGAKVKKRLADHPYFTQDKPDGDVSAVQYIANMQDGAVAGFKYFRFGEADRIRVAYSTSAEGRIEVATDEAFRHIVAHLPVSAQGACCNTTTVFGPVHGVQPLFFRYIGKGAINFYSFELFCSNSRS
ncbi:MAG: family 43 glycosylhydrolase [Clostridia bacterium]|nr:family 43 glycosylhydrolase [Clostridia bacterium]